MEFGSDGEGGENEKWYENDLLLAAELGKTLLERNKDLENQLIQTQQINYEQVLENEFLIKQLEALREVNETRMKIYEELDRNSNEVEKTNKRLLEESHTDKQKIQRLCNTVDSVEQRCSQLQEKLDDYIEKDRVKLKKERKKTLSVPSLLEATDNYYKTDRMTAEQFLNWKNPFESQLNDMTDTIRNLRAQQVVENRRKRNLEQDMVELMNENQQLSLKTEDLEEKLNVLKQNLETELNESEIRHSKVCKVCRSKIDIEADTAFATEIENDTVDIRSSCQLVRLRNGGSAYGSMETISKVANENRDNVEGQVPVNSGGVSLLSELDAQYKTLVEKYECLLRAKSKKIAYAGTHPETPYITPVTTPAATPDVEYSKPLSSTEVKVNKGVQVGSPLNRPRSFDLSVNSDPTSGHFDHSPEYKKLFKEIFETLKRSVIQEEAAAQI